MVYNFLKDCIPRDHCRQTRAIQIFDTYNQQRAHWPKTILDFGCGAGNSIDVFSSKAPAASWTGVDIEISPEVASRNRSGPQFVTYDGVTLPFPDNHFDLVFSNQVFEHVRHPEKVLKEICRVLTPEGLFIAQTSQLEPYHSYSVWNYTVYGFKTICSDAGLNMIEVRPAIDGITLIQRSLNKNAPEYNKWFAEESPINIEIENQAKQEGLSVDLINFRKLMYCGQFSFACEKM
ncbi:class I SAM-dependent methyltransferase [Phyllobacterium sp. YR531]|uniref:class I SAM-dependent methyltransferase n=1 Tax=Phyllobacterium sp. YR531 TaxID=1144343 RepID=UPI00026FAA15|nr:class I SAM-dependent methyltransferase [Phyllobacterium sp. YR531]EJN02273.1 methylase involved in ubiquinone/menaquinone biosynthesis [Phyllobacterium sp. YR531]